MNAAVSDNKRYNQALTWGTIALFAIPPLVDVYLHGWRRVFSYFAADAFYYLTVARNFSKLGFYTFDQERPTNGFHPLWQWFLSVLFVVRDHLGMSEPVTLVSIFIVNLIIIAFALWLILHGLAYRYRRIPAIFLLLPVGLWGFGPGLMTDSHYGNFWSYINGMESGLSLVAFSALVYLVLKHGRVTSVPIIPAGAILSILVLARLDNAFVLVAFSAPFIMKWATTRSGSYIRRLAAILVLPMLVLAGYGCLSWLQSSSPFPVSGTIKTSFPKPDNKWSPIWRCLQGNCEPPEVKMLLWRYTQLLLPLSLSVLGGAFLLSRLQQYLQRRITHEDPIEDLAIITGLLVIFSHGYYLLFVPIWDQGHWYFPISILAISLFGFIAINNLVSRVKLSRLATIAIRCAAPIAVVLCFIYSFADPSFELIYASLINKEQKSECAGELCMRAVYANTLDEGLSVVKHYGPTLPKLVEFDDGILAYSIGLKTMSGLGFNLDFEAARHLKQGTLLPLAYERGFDRIASRVYLHDLELDAKSSSDEIRRVLKPIFFLKREDLDQFDFSVDYQSQDKSFFIFKISRHDSR